MSDTFQEPGMLEYQRPKNLRDIIASNKILNNNVIQNKSTKKIIQILPTIHYVDNE